MRTRILRALIIPVLFVLMCHAFGLRGDQILIYGMVASAVAGLVS